MPTQIEDIKVKLLTDRRFYIEGLIQIPNKERIPVPFKFNRVQSELYEGLNEMKYAGMPVRAHVLKSRQMGVTSLIMAMFLVDCITRPNTTSVVIAHEEFITQRLLTKAKIFEASIPPELKPEMSHKSAYELAWEDIHSVFYIGSSRSFVFGRGERVDNALCSEIAFWNNPERITIPLGEGIPRNGTLIYESTPNGEENLFNSAWIEASSGWSRGTSLFRPFFFPWWYCDEYQLEPGEGLLVDASSPLKYTDIEQVLVSKHGLNEKQIRWRRMKLASPLAQMFFQEYPEDEHSCFLKTAEAVFDQDLLNAKAKLCYEPGSGFENAVVWFHPEEGHAYIVGADPTVGVHDKAAASVWDLKGLKLCAVLMGMYEPVTFASKIKLLGEYYNKALLVVENNNPGVAVLSYLTDYPNLYYHRDLVTGKPTGRAGWTTSSQSKSYMIQEFRKLLPELQIFSIDLIREAKNFRYVGLDVETVGEDDLMMSAMLALAARDIYSGKPALVGSWGWKRW